MDQRILHQHLELLGDQTALLAQQQNSVDDPSLVEEMEQLLLQMDYPNGHLQQWEPTLVDHPAILEHLHAHHHQHQKDYRMGFLHHHQVLAAVVPLACQEVLQASSVARMDSDCSLVVAADTVRTQQAVVVVVDSVDTSLVVVQQRQVPQTDQMDSPPWCSCKLW
jgi:hypothetical protein